MSLLDQRRIDSLIAIADKRVDHARELVRTMLYASGEESAPPGMVNLDTPEKVQLFSRYLSRQSEREQAGAIPGDLNQTMAEHPAVEQMSASAAQSSVQEAP